jgi:hypothetical protein
VNAPPVHPDLSPDAYAVLLDIAKQPGSMLLAVEPSKWSRELLEPSDLVRPSATFLTSAERHLVAAHGDELERWIWNLVNLQLTQHPFLSPFIHFEADRNTHLQLPSMDTCLAHLALLDQEARQNVSFNLFMRRDDPVRDLERLRRLVVVASRMRRRPALALFSGSLEMMSKRPAAAASHFRTLRREGGIASRLADEWIASSAAQQRHWTEACAHYRAATHSRWGVIDDVIQWGAMAYLAGESTELERAANMIEDFNYDEVAGRRVSSVLSMMRSDDKAALRQAASTAAVRSSPMCEVLRAIA